MCAQHQERSMSSGKLGIVMAPNQFSIQQEALFETANCLPIGMISRKEMKNTHKSHAVCLMCHQLFKVEQEGPAKQRKLNKNSESIYHNTSFKLRGGPFPWLRDIPIENTIVCILVVIPRIAII